VDNCTILAVTKKEIEMKNTTILNRAEKVFNYFVTSSSYKMGTLRQLVIVTPSGDVTLTKDNRTYYQGRGAKYNSTVKHGHIVETIKLADLNKVFNSRKATL
jgi:predicted proteasome-type protease